MTEPTGDRRARRSRKLLKQGLLELLREKGFSHISVRDITERMDMNRGTFYLHYPDTTALMRSVESDLIGEIQALVDAHMGETVEGRSLRPVFEPVLDYVVAHRETCAALFNSDSASGFLDQLQKLVYRNGRTLMWAALFNGPECGDRSGVRTGSDGGTTAADVSAQARAETGQTVKAEQADETEPPSEDEAANLLIFVTFGLVGLVKTWFDGNMALPREELLRTADALASGAAAGFRSVRRGGTAPVPAGNPANHDSRGGTQAEAAQAETAQEEAAQADGPAYGGAQADGPAYGGAQADGPAYGGAQADGPAGRGEEGSPRDTAV